MALTTSPSPAISIEMKDGKPLVETYGSGTSGDNNPQKSMYADYTAQVANKGQTLSMSAGPFEDSLGQTVYDPWGPGTRPVGGREYTGPWVDTRGSSGARPDRSYFGGTGNDLFKYNQFYMTVAQNFDPFMQKREAKRPHWWLNRIPRGAFQLFNGTVQETNIYRGGLGHYFGLSDWEELAPDPTVKDACAPLSFRTYQYAWEHLAWSGRRTAWGSDPICIETLKYVPKALEQIGWILETGVKFGTDIQNVWNRDMFIYTTVMAKRSYVMTNEYRGASSPRYVYQPFCKFVDSGFGDLLADKTKVSKPFIVIDASAGIEPLNFDVLDLVRGQLKRRCPDAAVGSVGNDLMFALAVSEEDVEKYIRGNEEERKYWIEANPNALIQHYGFAPTTFRKWTITCDDEQLRFKLKTYIPSYTSAVALGYGNVGLSELENKAVWIAEAVAPEIAGRPGINGSAVPVPNPEYDTAEIAIAPVFMNRVFTNLFVPDLAALGGATGTFFGPKKGLNGKWAWYNIQTPDNPDQKVGNFKGEFDIVPKPDVCVYDCISFVYRRCSDPLPSYCPSENTKIAIHSFDSVEVAAEAKVSQSKTTVVINLNKGCTAAVADTVNVKVTSGSTTTTLTGYVIESVSPTAKKVQFVGLGPSETSITKGSMFEVVR